MSTVTLLDTVTGETRVVENAPRASEWAENNYSCDCNRMTYFGMPLDVGVCVGAHRFIVTQATFCKDDDGGYSLRELNDHYAPELLDKHL